jgi:hypothetical protein
MHLNLDRKLSQSAGSARGCSEAAAARQVSGRLLFVNKKKQKNFVKLGRAGFAASGPD